MVRHEWATPRYNSVMAYYKGRYSALGWNAVAISKIMTFTGGVTPVTEILYILNGVAAEVIRQTLYLTLCAMCLAFKSKFMTVPESLKRKLKNRVEGMG